jgi:hypothetical protein
MQVLQVLQARHLFACSFSIDSNSLKVIELLATKSLSEDSLYCTAVVDTYDILPQLHGTTTAISTSYSAYITTNCNTLPLPHELFTIATKGFLLWVINCLSPTMRL